MNLPLALVAAATFLTTLFGGYATGQAIQNAPVGQPSTFGALSILKVSQGGTGASSFTAGECLVGNGTGAITTSACGSGGSGFSTTSADYHLTATTSLPRITTLAGLTTITSTLSGLLGANSGVLYSFASSSLFGYTPLNPTRQLTVAGTANQLTSSAGAQDLSADRTWTLSLPSHVIFPGNFQAGNSSTTNATSTSLGVTNLVSCDSIDTDSTGSLRCGTDATATGAANPFTWSTNYAVLTAATSSVLWAQSGIFASSTSQIQFASTSAISILGTPLSTSTVVCRQSGACEFTTIQAALTAGRTNIFVRNGVYSEQLTLQNAKTRIVGESLNAIVQCNGVTQSPCLSTNAKDEFYINSLTIRETNAVLSGIAIDFSDSALGIIDGIRTSNFATSTYAHDTVSNTFYNRLTQNTFFNTKTCIDLGGTQPNQTFSSENRCRPMAVPGGFGVYLSDTRGYTSVGDDFEATTTASGSTGIFVDATSREISFTNPWVEANTNGVVIAAGANRVTFINGSITSNGTDISDSGTNTVWLNTSRTGNLKNELGNATTTSLGITNAASCSGTQALTTTSSGSVVCSTITGSGGAAFPFTPTTNFGVNTSATSTPIFAQGSIFASSTSYFNTISALTSSTTNASTTNISGRTLAYGGTATTTISATGALFTPTLTVGTLTGLAYTSSGAVSAVTNGVLGTNGVMGIAGGIPAYVATSTLFGSATPGNVLGFTGGVWAPMATATCLQITGSADLCDGSDATAAGAANPFIWTNNYGVVTAATSSIIWAQSGIFASSTSRLATTTIQGSGLEVVRVNNSAGTSALTVNTTSMYMTTPWLLVNGAGGGAKLDVKGDGGTIIRGEATAATDVGFSAFVTGDSFLRFSFLADGTLKWGPGATGSDTGLSRLSASRLGIGDGSSLTNGSLIAQQIGIGSTTPWAVLAVASSTYNYRSPLFMIATSSDRFGQVLTVTATSSSFTKTDPAHNDTGARVTIGASPFPQEVPLDQLEVEGRINQKVLSVNCDHFGGSITQLTADTNFICGNYLFNEDTAAVFDIGITSASAVYGRLRTGTAGTTAAAGDGASVTLHLSALTQIHLASSTPVLEVVARIGVPANSTSSLYYIGFGGAGGNADVTALPNDGCAFIASSTSPANWTLFSRGSGSSNYTTTGVATTTATTGVGDFYKFRIEASAGRCVGYITNLRSGAVTKTVSPASITAWTNTATVQISTSNASAGLTNELHVRSTRLWMSGYNEPQ